MPMIARARLIGCILLIAVPAIAPATMSGDCVRVTFDAAEVLRHADVVFSGVVIKVDDINDRLRFRVDRFWKGRSDGRRGYIYSSRHQLRAICSGPTLRLSTSLPLTR